MSRTSSGDAFQQRQAEYAAKHWQHHGGNEEIRHVLLHLVKLTGKLATYCEAVEHGGSPSTAAIRDEVIPDLLFHAAQLGNNLGVEVVEAHRARLAYLAAMWESGTAP